MRTTTITVTLLIGVLVILSACTRLAPASPAPNEAQVTMTPTTTLATPPAKTPVTATTSHYNPSCAYCHRSLDTAWAIPTVPPTPPTTRPTIPDAVLAVQGRFEVWINGREYRPSVLIVPVETTITWINKDGEGWHSVTSTTGLFDTQLAFGQSFSYTFTKPGIYEYYSVAWPAETLGVVHVISPFIP